MTNNIATTIAELQQLSADQALQQALAQLDHARRELCIARRHLRDLASIPATQLTGATLTSICKAAKRAIDRSISHDRDGRDILFYASSLFTVEG